jgi:hypothetical protein
MAGVCNIHRGDQIVQVSYFFILNFIGKMRKLNAINALSKTVRRTQRFNLRVHVTGIVSFVTGHQLRRNDAGSQLILLLVQKMHAVTIRKRFTADTH